MTHQYEIKKQLDHNATPEELRELANKQPTRTPFSGNGQGIFWPELVSAADLLSIPPDPTRWLWDQTLPAGGCSVMVAKPKVGKTTLCACLSLAVARGWSFLGRKTERCPVAYISLDATLNEMAETFIGLGIERSDPIFIHAGAAPQKVVQWLMQRVKENGVRLIIIDTLQKLFKFQDINDYSPVINAVEPLLNEARNENLHLMFTHHARKESLDDLDAGIGSTAIRGMAYTYLHMKRLPASDRRILLSDQRGGKNFPEIAVGLDERGWTMNEGTREEAEVTDMCPQILQLLDDIGQLGMQEKDIRRHISGKGWIIGLAIRKLYKEGGIERTGKGGKGDPFMYSAAGTLVSTPEKEKDLFR